MICCQLPNPDGASEAPDRSILPLTGLLDWLRGRFRSRATVAELDALGSRELGDIAHDVGATAGELRAMAGKWPDSANLLARRMSVLHLDGHEIKASEPAVNQDLQKHCSLCDAKSRCIDDLEHRSVDPKWRGYCPNSYTLLALREERDRRGNLPGRPQPAGGQ